MLVSKKKILKWWSFSTEAHKESKILRSWIIFLILFTQWFKSNLVHNLTLLEKISLTLLTQKNHAQRQEILSGILYLQGQISGEVTNATYLNIIDVCAWRPVIEKKLLVQGLSSKPAEASPFTRTYGSWAEIKVSCEMLSAYFVLLVLRAECSQL